MNGAVICDVRCAALESACVQITLQACQRGLPPEPSHSQQGQTSGDTPALTVVEAVSHTSRVRLVGVDLQEVFDRRLRVVQCCPHYLRGRFRDATRCALEARHQTVRSQDRTMETRVWKLFCLVPFLLLRQPFGGRRVSREDLSERFDVAHIARRRVGGRPQGHLQGKNVYSGSKGQGRMPESAVG